jgi:hypothetical protein
MQNISNKKRKYYSIIIKDKERIILKRLLNIEYHGNYERY